MGLYKRGQTWWISLSYKGRQVRHSTETDDKKLAEKVYHKVVTEVIEGKYFEKQPGENMLFEELMKEYMREHSSKNKTPKSHVPDKSLSKHLLGHFKHFLLTDITPRMVSEYKIKRLEEKAAPKTVLNELVLLGHVFALAAGEWELLNENPVRRVRKPTFNDQINRWLSYDEEARLLNASPHWLKEIILFAVNMGLRQGEIPDLRWSHVDLFRKTLYISEQKNKQKDTLPLNEKALDVLKQRARVRQLANNYVFVNMDGNRINTGNLLRAFYSSCHKAEITDLRFHDLRHTFATRLVQAGVDLYAVQKLGRCKNITMLQRYAHHYPESLRPGVEVLDRFVTNLSQSEKEGVNRDG